MQLPEPNWMRILLKVFRLLFLAVLKGRGLDEPQFTTFLNQHSQLTPFERCQLRQRLRAMSKITVAASPITRIVFLIVSLKSTSPIDRMPGSFLSIVLRWILTTKFYDRVIEPTIADSQYEYVQTVSAHQWRRAKWIKLRVWLIVGWVLLKSPVALMVDAAVDRFSAK